MLQKLSFEESCLFLQNQLHNQSITFCISDNQRVLSALDSQNEKLWDFKLPLAFPKITNLQDLQTFRGNLSDIPPNYFILLFQAGNAALGYFEEGKLDSHKVIRKYMVRAKQGKAQIGHLKTKGKSKAGSRIRLAQTKQFFEEIGEKIEEWEINTIDFIFRSSSIQLWNLLFDSKNKIFFEKRDKKIVKIPLTIPTPNYRILLKVNRYILTGFLNVYQEKDE